MAEYKKDMDFVPRIAMSREMGAACLNEAKRIANNARSIARSEYFDSGDYLNSITASEEYVLGGRRNEVRRGAVVEAKVGYATIAEVGGNMRLPGYSPVSILDRALNQSTK